MPDPRRHRPGHRRRRAAAARPAEWTAVVAQAPASRPATERQPHAPAVARAAPVGPLTGTAAASAAVVRRVLTVVSEAEEPDEPEHE